MSSTSVAERPIAETAERPMSAPLRNLCLTFALAICSLAIVGMVWEQTGYEMLIVAMGWPHVILGFLFYFGKVLRGQEGARSSFLLLTLATLAIWTLHYTFAITWLIYVYFLYHAFRDEIFVYLQTRARHNLRGKVYDVAGVTPLILLLLVIAQPQDFRQDLRRVELADAAFADDGWTLIPFKPVHYSGGRDFYFYLQAPHTEGLNAFTTEATLNDSRSDGEVRISDAKWSQAADLVFRPHYRDEGTTQPVEQQGEINNSSSAKAHVTIPVLLTGGHTVGQTFTAARDNLAGIWVRTRRSAQDGADLPFVFRLASPPLLPFSPALSDLRLALIVLLGALVLWKLLPRVQQNRELWLYLAIFAVIFMVLQTTVKTANRIGYTAPMLFQFVVVFHYFSWYVFSLDKLRTAAPPVPTNSQHKSFYDQMLACLRNRRQFVAAVVALNLTAAAGSLWYYQLNSPAAMRYGFDYNYFLYILVFHVTFSFNPKHPPAPKTASPG
ncbi:MAG: hypothetical protein H0T92_19485 [Pyrinomonadaceae bacterium]|nr:hypothetical protein [Pyrinomonadaceae bacterium]